MGRNGMGKTTLLKCIMGLLPAALGDDHVRRDDLRALPAEAGPGSASATCRRAARSSRSSPSRRTCRSASASRRTAARAIPAADLRAVSGAQADAAPARRRPVGRPAAAARHRPRARARTDAADPRRADRGIQPNIVHEIGDILLRLNRDEGLTVLLVEQKLPFARRVASDFSRPRKGPGAWPAARSSGLTDDVVKNHLTV